MLLAFEKILNLKEPQLTLLRNLVILVLIGAILILTGSIFTDKAMDRDIGQEGQTSTAALSTRSVGGTSSTRPDSSEDYGRQLSERLTALLMKISGAGRVAVEVSFEGGYQYSFAINRTEDDTVTQEKDPSGGSRVVTTKRRTDQVVTVRGNSTEEPLILEVKKPVIKGVLVVAEGAGNSQVKARMAEAVRTFLGIPAYKVTIVEGKFN